MEKESSPALQADEATLRAAAVWAFEGMVRAFHEPGPGESEAAARDAMEALERVLERMHEPVPRASFRIKRFLCNVLLDASGTRGMVSPFTLEIHLSKSLLPVEVPFLAAHEAAHVLGFASEQEANFLAFEACLETGRPLARFSAFFALFPYLYPSLPPEEGRALVAHWPEGVRDRLRRIQERDQRYEGTLMDTLRMVYDIYLRFHSVKDGIKSYARFARWVAAVHAREAEEALARCPFLPKENAPSSPSTASESRRTP